jgi:tetratricopeptide (TPR) repeat protein
MKRTDRPLVWIAPCLFWTLILGSSPLLSVTTADGAIDETTEAQANAERVAALIKQLGDEKFIIRERAQAELQQIGPPALDALTMALEDDDIEIVMRATYLLSAIKVQWALDTDPEGIRSLVEDYSKKSESERREVMQGVADAEAPEKFDVLARMVRYERSLPLSKKAALLLTDLLTDKATDDEIARVTKILADSDRTGAAWVRAYIPIRNDPAKLADHWKKITDEERKLWSETSSTTGYVILQELLFKLVELLEKAGRSDETVPYLEQIVELQPGDADSIKSLVDWLLKKESHKLIVAVGEKYPDVFGADPMLLYALAYSYRGEGQDAQAKQTAERALKLPPINPRISVPQYHFVMGYNLQERGWFEFAESEYREAVKVDGLDGEFGVRATFLLSEMLHDQHYEQRAGEAVKPLVDQINERGPALRILQLMGRDAGSIKSRMKYFFALHAQDNGEPDKAVTLLDEAAADDPTDADVLIALYRLPNQDAQRQARTKQMIQSAAALFRRQIQAGEGGDNESATPCNQFAWLVGNTLAETDKALAEEAVRYSHKSLELRPDAAGYLDTLGRCYYAKGDLAKAVEHQSKAAELEPHSGLIRSQLELFQKALAEAEKKDNN